MIRLELPNVFVAPAKAGVQGERSDPARWISRFRGNDGSAIERYEIISGYNARKNATRSCFYCGASLAPSLKLKNWTVSSNVRRRSSCI